MTHEPNLIKNSHVIFVCITCKKYHGDDVINEGAGQEFLDAFNKHLTTIKHPFFDIKPVSCLSACKNACAVALTHPKKYSYIFGGLAPEHINDLLTLMETYSHDTLGVLKKIHRPESLKTKVLGRVPPLDLCS